MYESLKNGILCLCMLLFCVGITLHMNSWPQEGRCYQANLMLWKILKDSFSPLKHIVIILIGFSTQAETSVFLSIVFHSAVKLERNKGDQA